MMRMRAALILGLLTQPLLAQESGDFDTGAFPESIESPSSDCGCDPTPNRLASELSHPLGWDKAGLIILLVSACQFLIALWLRSRLQYSVKYEYDRVLKDYEFALKKREQSSEIAKFLASFTYGDTSDKKRHMAGLWELSLWLPPQLVCDLSEFVVNPDKRDPKELIIRMRKELHGENDWLEASQIAHYDPNKRRGNSHPE